MRRLTTLVFTIIAVAVLMNYWSPPVIEPAIRVEYIWLDESNCTDYGLPVPPTPQRMLTRWEYPVVRGPTNDIIGFYILAAGTLIWRFTREAPFHG